MSTSVEQRIVEMKFDNKGFAEGVQDTLKDLDTLDKATKFEGGIQGLKSLQKSADNVNFSALVNSVQSINDSLNHMQSFSFQVFESIAQKAADTMTRVVKSLSVDQIKGGFKEYELKMDSIRTIMSSSGESLETVNKKLMELNEYSDKTIYSFSDMTSSIGKFTNAGVNLDDAVAAIQGISNEAAVAGANSNEASRAMYNFAQALSAGSVKLIDWKSIDNANMGTVEFKQALIDTAVALGTVQEAEEGYISTTTDAKGNVSDLFTSTTGWNEALNYQWLTTEVLTQALKNYATDTREMTEAEREAWIEQMKATGYTEEQIEAFERLGQKAFDAAQEVTTFSKMADALKESVGSGWAQTFEILFGDLEQAKKLWTGINDVLSGVISSISDTRNGILEMWKAAGGHTYVVAGLKEIWEAIKNIAHYIGLALETIAGHRYLQNLERVKSFFADRNTFSGNLVIIQKITTLLETMSQKFFDIARKIRSAFNPNFQESLNLLHDIYQATQAIIIPLRFIFKIVTGVAGKLIPVILKAAIAGLRGVVSLLATVGRALTEGGLYKTLYALADTIVDKFGQALDFVVRLVENGFGKIRDILGDPKTKKQIQDITKLIGKKLRDALKTVQKKLRQFTNTIKQLRRQLEPVFTFLNSKLKEISTNLKNFWQNNEKLNKAKTWIRDFFNSFTNPFKSNNSPLKTTKDLTKEIDNLVKGGMTLEDATKKVQALNGSFDDLGGMLEYLKGRVSAFFETLANSKPVKMIQELFDSVVGKIKDNKIFQAVQEFVQPFINAFKEAFGDIKLSDLLGTVLGDFDEFKTRIANLDTTSLATMWAGFIDALKDLGEALRGFAFDKFDGLITRITEFWNVLKPKDTDPSELEEPLYKRMASAAQAMLMGLVEGIRTFGWDEVFKIIRGAISLYLIGRVISLFQKGDKALSVTQIIANTITGIAKNIGAVIEAQKWDVMATALLKAAKAVLIMAGALVILALVPADALERAVSAIVTIGIILGLLILAKGYADKLTGKTVELKNETKKMEDITREYLEILNTFVINITTGFKNMLNKIGTGAVIIGVVMGVIGIVFAISKLIGMTGDEFKAGLIRVTTIIILIGAVIVALTGLEKVAKVQPNFLGISITILAFSKVVNDFSKLIGPLSAIPWTQFWDALGKMGLTMTLVVGIMYLLGKIKNTGDIAKVSGIMILMAIGLTALCVPLIILSSIPIEQLGNALVMLMMLAGVFAGLSFAASKLTGLVTDMGKFVVAILGFIGMAAGLYIIAQAITVLCNTAPMLKEYGGVLTAFAVGLIVVIFVLAGIGDAMGGGALAISGALALIGLAFFLVAEAFNVFANGVSVLTDAVIKFSQNMDMITKAVNGKKEAIIEAVSTIVSGVVIGILQGLQYIGIAIIEGIDSLYTVLDAKIFDIGVKLGSSVVKGFGGIIVGVTKGFGDTIDAVWDYFTGKYKDKGDKVLEGTGLGQKEQIEKVTEEDLKPAAQQAADSTIFSYEDQYNKYLANGGSPGLGNMFNSSITNGLPFQQKLNENAAQAADSTIQTFNGPLADPANATGTGSFLDNQALAIWGRTPDLAEASTGATDAVVSNLNFADILSTLGSDTDGALGGVTDALQKFQGEASGIAGDTSIDVSDALANINGDSAAEEGMMDYNEALKRYGIEPPETAADITTDITDTMKDGEYAESGEYGDEQLAEGLDKNKDVVIDTSKSVATDAGNAAGSMASIWQSNAWNLVQGLANGIIENSHIAEDAGREMTRNTLDAMQEEADEHSPSKETYKFAYFMVKGMANGFDENGDILEKSARSTTRSTLDTLRNTMLEAMSMLDDSFNGYSPTITPVLDSSQIQYGMRGLNDILNGAPYANIGANVSVGKVDVGSAVGELSSLTSQGNSDLLDALRAQSRQTEHLIYLLENQKIYLDGNTLVGKTISRIDNALGQRAVLAGRRG